MLKKMLWNLLSIKGNYKAPGAGCDTGWLGIPGHGVGVREVQILRDRELPCFSSTILPLETRG